MFKHNKVIDIIYHKDIIRPWLVTVTRRLFTNTSRTFFVFCLLMSVHTFIILTFVINVCVRGDRIRKYSLCWDVYLLSSICMHIYCSIDKRPNFVIRRQTYIAKPIKDRHMPHIAMPIIHRHLSRRRMDIESDKKTKNTFPRTSKLHYLNYNSRGIDTYYQGSIFLMTYFRGEAN